MNKDTTMKKLGNTYPCPKTLATFTKTLWNLELEPVTRKDGATVYVHSKQYEDGSSISLSTPVKLKIGHHKLFNTIIEQWWAQSNTKEEKTAAEIYVDERVVDEVKNALGIPFEKIPENAHVIGEATLKDYNKAVASRLRAIVGEEGLDLAKKAGITTLDAIRDDVVAFVKTVSDDEKGKPVHYKNEIRFSIRDVLDRVGRKECRKAQRDLLLDELKSLVSTSVSFNTADGRVVTYSLLSKVDYDPRTDLLTIVMNDELMQTFQYGGENTIKFLSSCVTRAAKSHYTLMLSEYLQMAGRGRQSNGYFGYVTSASINELVDVMSLSDGKVSQQRLRRAFNELADITGVCYTLDRRTHTYNITEASKAIKDIKDASSETLDAGILEHQLLAS